MVNGSHSYIGQLRYYVNSSTIDIAGELHM